MLQYINMFRCNSILFFFLVLISIVPFNVHACSVAPPVVPWKPGYKIYSHFNQSKPFDEFDSITIVTPSFEEVAEIDFKGYTRGDRGREKFTHVNFNVLKVLKGKQTKNFYLRGGGTGFETVRPNSKTTKLKKSIIRDPIYLTNLSDEDEENKYWSGYATMYAKALSVAEYRATSSFHKRLGFFDLFDLTIPRIGEPTTGVTCGSHIEYTVFPEMTYIAFKKEDRVVYLEPILDEDDPLISIISSLLDNERPKQLNTTLPEFLKPKRIVIFEISDCPTQNEDLNNIETKLPTIGESSRFKNLRRTLNHKEYYTFPYSKFDILYDTETWRPSHQPIPFTLANLSNYFDQLSEVELKCKSGDLYMGVQKSKYEFLRVYPAFRSQSRKYDWRFLRIQNEEVISSDLLTNISISGPNQIPLSEIIR